MQNVSFDQQQIAALKAWLDQGCGGAIPVTHAQRLGRRLGISDKAAGDIMRGRSVTYYTAQKVLRELEKIGCN